MLAISVVSVTLKTVLTTVIRTKFKPLSSRSGFNSRDTSGTEYAMMKAGMIINKNQSVFAILLWRPTDSDDQFSVRGIYDSNHNRY